MSDKPKRSVRERRDQFENGLGQGQWSKSWGEDDESKLARQYAESRQNVARTTRGRRRAAASSNSEAATITPQSSFDDERPYTKSSPMSSYDELIAPPEPKAQGGMKKSVELLASVPDGPSEKLDIRLPQELAAETSDDASDHADSGVDVLPDHDYVQGNATEPPRGGKVAQLEDAIRQRCKDRDDTERRVNEMAGTVKAAEEKISKLETQLENQIELFHKTRTFSKGKFESLERKINSLKDDLERKEREKRQLRDQLEEKERRIRELERQLEEANREIEELSTQRRRERAQNEALQEVKRAAENDYRERQLDLERNNQVLKEWIRGTSARSQQYQRQLEQKNLEYQRQLGRQQQHQQQQYQRDLALRERQQQLEQQQWALQRAAIEAPPQRRSKSRDRSSRKPRSGRQQLALARSKNNRQEVLVVR